MTRRATAPGKIILSGEYAVVFGHRGIAVPSKQAMEVQFEEDLDAPGLAISFGVEKLHTAWIDHVRNVVSHCEKHETEPFRGTLTLTTDLPLGKGMGSSTAVVIAVCRCLLGDDCEAQAKAIEDAVNPGNSGLDFAVIWRNTPVVFKKGEELTTVTLDLVTLSHAELIDTGMPEQTTPELVAWVTEQSKSSSGKPWLSALETIGQCTERLLAGEDLKTVMRDHHRAQVQLGVVPKPVQELIANIERDGGSAKVIGAGARTGGGGMVLVLR